MLAVMRFPEESMVGKVTIMAIFSVPALVFLFLGLWRRPVGTRRRAAGITLLSTAGWMVFLAYYLWSMMTSPEMAKFMKPETRAAFSDYLWGGCWMALYALVGGGLLWFSRGKERLS